MYAHTRNRYTYSTYFFTLNYKVSYRKRTHQHTNTHTYLHSHVLTLTRTHTHTYLHSHVLTLVRTCTGHPIVGDTKYGAKQSFSKKDIALHAYSLTIPHPITNIKVIDYMIIFYYSIYYTIFNFVIHY